MVFNYELKKNPRAKYLKIAVYQDQRVVITIPKRASVKDAYLFLAQKTNWILSKLNYFKAHSIHTKPKHRGQEYAEYKEKATQLAVVRVNHFSKIYNVNFGKITIRNQKTRWGSCSKKGNLNFNYKLAFLPTDLADYIVAHEVCHLIEFNHSKKFWNLVSKSFPNYKMLRKSLRKYSLDLL